MRRKKDNILLSGLCCMALCMFGASLYQRQVKVMALDEMIYTEDLFNLHSGFYDKDIEIKLNRGDENIKVYYTLDGSIPTKKSQLLSGTIKIDAEEQEKIIHIKTKIYYDDADLGEFSYTYLVGKNIYKRFKTKVMDISIDNSALFDEKKGIFVKGEKFNKYVENGGDSESAEAFLLTNYKQRGKDWLRDADIRLFDNQGEELVHAGVLIGIDGNGSSVSAVKSLKLYLDTDTFPYNAVFGSDRKWDKLLLRSGGQEFDLTTIRWDVICDLAQQMEFYPLAEHDLVTVYINGQYYATMSLSQEYSNENIKEMCSLPVAKKIQKIVGGNDTVFDSQYNYNDFSAVSLEERRRAIENLIDVENMFKYYAIEFFTNNQDWPNSNYKIWRYTGENVSDNFYTDGRWRFLLYDMDLTYLSESNWRSEIFGKNNLVKTFQNSSFDILVKSMEDEYFRNRFINYICGLMGTIFETKNVTRVIEKYDDIMQHEIEYYEISKYNEGAWLDIYKTNRNNYVEEMKNAACNRNTEIKDFFKNYFKFNPMYKLTIANSPVDLIIGDELIKIKKNKGTYEAEYFIEIPNYIELLEGENEYCFLINGALKIDKSEVVVDADWIENGEINIQIIKK